ncbi:hypothetical protein [Flavobacterium nitrogenifigens]|nr:hypothetical protein [Flavobacterium nitrogenifigens]
MYESTLFIKSAITAAIKAKSKGKEITIPNKTLTINPTLLASL